MSNTAFVDEKNEVAIEKTEAELLEEQTARRARALRRACLGLGTFGVLILLFLSIMHLFVGTGKVFSVSFSILGIVEWLKILPDVRPSAPEQQLAQLIIGVLFFIMYIISSVIIVKTSVRAIRQLIEFFDDVRAKLDYKTKFLSLCEHISLGFSAGFSFALVALSSTNQNASLGLIILFALYAIFFIVATVKINADFCDATDENYTKTVVLNTVKRVSLIVVVGALTFVCLNSQLFQFTKNIGQNYKTSVRFTGITAVNKYAFPLLQWLLAVNSIQLLKAVMQISEKTRQDNKYSFYGQSYQIGQNALQMESRKRRKRIIFWSVVCCLLSVLFACFNTKNEFVTPSVNELVMGRVIYLVIIALAITAYILSKPKKIRPPKTTK